MAPPIGTATTMIGPMPGVRKVDDPPLAGPPGSSTPARRVGLGAALETELADGAGALTTGPAGSASGRPTPPPVGSKSTQPAPGNHASTQACAWSRRIVSRPLASRTPGRNPSTNRAGIPATRSIITIAEA